MIGYSYCRICPALCGITVEVDDDSGRVVDVTGDAQHPLSAGFSCSKGRALTEDHNAPDRLTGSLVRRDGEWRPVPSGDAIADIAARLSAIVEQHGPRSVGLYVGTRGYEVLQLAGATAWLGGIGSPSLYSTYTIDQPGKDIARALHGSWPAGLQDFATSDVVMFVGNNPVVSATAAYIGMPVANPRRALRGRKKDGLKILVIDPRRTETAQLADIHLQPIPGEDPAVLAGLIRVMLTEGLIDEEFVRQHTTGVQMLLGTVDSFTPEEVERRAGVPAELLIDAARMFAAGRRGCAIGGTGINMSPHPVLSEYLLLCLNTLGGRYMRAGDVVTNPGVLGPGRALREGARSPRTPWGKGPQPRVRGLSSLYNQMPAAALADEILLPGEGQLRALIVTGGNPVVALPDMARTIEAFEQLELLVTLDVRMTQTTRLSDYVIGCPMSLERTDVTLASDLRFPQPFAQYAPALAAPPGDLVEEWEFFWALAQAMGTPWDLRQRIGMPVPIDVGGELPVDRKPTTEQLWELLCGGTSIPLKELRKYPHGYGPVDREPVYVQPAPEGEGARLELADVSMMDELAELSVPADSTPDFPLRLISRRLAHFHNSWGQTLEGERAHYGGNPLRMHPDDMAACGVEDQEYVEVISERGVILAPVECERELRPGVVSMAHCWGSGEPETDLGPLGANTGALVDNSREFSQVVGMPRQSAVPVRIEKHDSDRVSARKAGGDHG